MREIVVRRGREFYEYKFREQNDNKFKTTKIPARPLCEKPAHCKWCSGILVGHINLSFPVVQTVTGVRHVLMPVQACHLVAMEYCQAHPGEPITAGWLLSEEEIAAGRKGMEWPADTGGKEQ